MGRAGIELSRETELPLRTLTPRNRLTNPAPSAIHTGQSVEMAAPTMLSPGQVIEEAPAPGPKEWEQNLNQGLMCPDCRELPPNLMEDFSSGDTVCTSCGLVLGERMQDTRSEWRTFANDESGGEDPSRVGKAESPLELGHLETDISYGDGGMRSRELNRAHSKLVDDKGRRVLEQAYSEIANACSKFNLPDTVIEHVKWLFFLTHNERLFKGKNPEAIKAGCIFIGCRQMKVGRSFKEIQRATHVQKKDIGRTYKVLQDFLRKKGAASEAAGTGASANYTDNHTTSIEELCGRYGSLLTMEMRAINASKAIAANLKRLGLLAGRSPLSTAGACLYMGSHLVGNPKSPKAIMEVASVSDSTIRNAYKVVLPRVKDVVNKEWLLPTDPSTHPGVIRGGDLARLPPG